MTQLLHLSGGNKRNAIARECTAKLRVPNSQRSTLEAEFRNLSAHFGAQFVEEPNITLSLEVFEESTIRGVGVNRVISQESTKRLLCLLTSLPHGVIKMSSKFKVFKGLGKRGARFGWEYHLQKK